MMVSNSTKIGAAAAVALMLACVGCKPHDQGVAYSEHQAAHVDGSWLIAANRCWPEMSHQGLTVADVKHYLADPLHFRAVFSGYASETDAQLMGIIGQPAMSAPAPDPGVLNSSSNPVLTRTEALTGANPNGTLTTTTNGIAPNDALCAIQPGVPVGFK